MRRLAGLRSVTLIHHSLTDCIPPKAQHTNTISSTAGHLTRASLTRLHANSITANAAPLSNTSVIGWEILRLCTKLVQLSLSLSLSVALFLSLHPILFLKQSLAAFCHGCLSCSIANTLICLWKLLQSGSAHNWSAYVCQCEGSHWRPFMNSYFTTAVHHQDDF